MAAASILRRPKPRAIMSVLPSALRSTPATSSSPSSSSSSSVSAAAQYSARRTETFSLPTQAPPVPRKIPSTVSAHGMTWQDPYRWMRNTDDPDFIDFLDRENSYAQAFMADTEALRSDLVSEMKSRIPTEISTPPERWGPWLYKQYIPEGKEYPVLCRRLENGETGWFSRLFGREKGKEEVLLDWNQIAEQYGYVHVGVCRISPDHNYLAYTVDPSGSERFLLQIKDLRTGRLVPRSRTDGAVSLAWALDGKTLFYTVSDENQRPHRVMSTNVESDGNDDSQVFVENDSSFCLDITSTKDGKFVTINSNSRTSSEVYVISADYPSAGLRRVRRRAVGVQYFLEHHNGLFYILTNAPTSGTSERSGKGYYLTRCRVEEIEASNWQTVIHPDDNDSIQDMDMFDDYMVLFLNKNGLPVISSIDMPIRANPKDMRRIEDLNPWYFPLPSDHCSVVPGSNHDFTSSIYRLVLSSPVIPDTIIDYDVPRRSFSILQEEGVTGNPDIATSPAACSVDNITEVQDVRLSTKMDRLKNISHGYVCERREVPSHDGVEIPLTILYSRKAWQMNRSPGILIGYGAYGEVLDKNWCSNRLSMLDRGWAIAFADVRGGGGGEDLSWHKSGTGLNKKNSIQDFIACANYLIDEGYVQRQYLAAIGYSAGCVLPAAAMNMHPGLFRAAILKVPFLDVLNTLMDPSLPLTVLDYEEFGNPQTETDFECIRSYSPYENIREGVCYPSMLVQPSFHDQRQAYSE